MTELLISGAQLVAAVFAMTIPFRIANAWRYKDKSYLQIPPNGLSEDEFAKHEFWRGFWEWGIF